MFVCSFIALVKQLPPAAMPPIPEPGQVVVGAAQVIKEKLDGLRTNINARMG